jgi:hypothetical protein
MNRRIRNRTYGGVGGRGGQLPLLPDSGNGGRHSGIEQRGRLHWLNPNGAEGEWVPVCRHAQAGMKLQAQAANSTPNMMQSRRLDGLRKPIELLSDSRSR